MDGWVDEWMDGRRVLRDEWRGNMNDERMGRWMDGWMMVGCMEGREDGEMDGRMDG